MGEERDLRTTQLPDRGQMLPDPRVVQQLTRRRIDRGIDVDAEQDRAAREVEIIHREEVPGHPDGATSRRIIVFLHAAGTGRGSLARVSVLKQGNWVGTFLEGTRG